MYDATTAIEHAAREEISASEGECACEKSAARLFQRARSRVRGDYGEASTGTGAYEQAMEGEQPGINMELTLSEQTTRQAIAASKGVCAREETTPRGLQRASSWACTREPGRVRGVCTSRRADRARRDRGERRSVRVRGDCRGDFKG